MVGSRYFRKDVNWLDRATGDEHTGVWRPLLGDSSPFQRSLEPVAVLGPQSSEEQEELERAAMKGTGGAGVQGVTEAAMKAKRSPR